MARSAAIRSRIEAFENGKPIPILSESPPNNSWTFVSKPRQVSPLDELLSPWANTVALTTPSPTMTPTPPRSRSPSILGRKSSLVDVSEIASLVSSAPSSLKSTSEHLFGVRSSPPAKVPPPVPPRYPGLIVSSLYPSPTSSKSAGSEFALNKDSPSSNDESRNPSPPSIPSTSKPPLPPRRPDAAIADDIPGAIPNLYPQDRNMSDTSASPAYTPSFSQVEPEPQPMFGLIPPRPGHAHANSTSSFQSVSLSDSTGGDMTDSKDSPSETPSRSVAETVAALNRMDNTRDRNSNPVPENPSIVVPYAPRLPPRRRGTQGVVASSAPQPTPPAAPSIVKSKPAPPPRPAPLKGLTPGYNFPSVQIPSLSIRRVAPPLPSVPSISLTNMRTSGFNSSSPSGFSYPPILPSSNTPITSASSGKNDDSALLSEGPVPSANRIRYEALFERNLSPPRQTGRHVESPSSSSSSSRGSGWRNVSAAVGGRLPGYVVKRIWLCSKLDRSFLRRLWAELDKEGNGALDKESFVRGLWRIDAELSKSRRSRKSLR
ncbi:uncharacterized protein EI90DRAFT_3064285 [Cantharellus anzutake]|uniref:uncharacterized protein n=1 Tax=Cantharellus anzutake TaxID=1750568 RepID=UPI001903F063|nr:uncharacterized protein EI90DRAFT_3064285 [Cantharellus anzutake]KAF8328695.1 hypothetical protein EI90DRAFT_3064285 [Cantharellus anzutake]